MAAPGRTRKCHVGTVTEAEHLPTAIETAARGSDPVRERRKQVADQLYEALVASGYSFWDHIYPLFIARDITRHDIRELVRRGLGSTRGNYRALAKLFGMKQSDYKRFLNFLAAHDCRADFREFRDRSAPVPLRPRLALPPLEEQRVPVHNGSVQQVEKGAKG